MVKRNEDLMLGAIKELFEWLIVAIETTEAIGSCCIADLIVAAEPDVYQLSASD